jgi:hypothetical protein
LNEEVEFKGPLLPLVAWKRSFSFFMKW